MLQVGVDDGSPIPRVADRSERSPLDSLGSDAASPFTMIIIDGANEQSRRLLRASLTFFYDRSRHLRRFFTEDIDVPHDIDHRLLLGFSSLAIHPEGRVPRLYCFSSD